MTRHGVTVLLGILCLTVAMVWAQDRITEEDVVGALNGMPRLAAPGHPLGVALHVTFSPQPGAEAKGNRALSGGTLQADEGLYKTLIPLAQALETEMVRGSRFVMRVAPTSSLPIEDANILGQQLADRLEYFLTTYFAIPHERLSWQVTVSELTAERPGAQQHGPQRWRLEVFRQE